MARQAAIAAMAVGCSGATTMHTFLTFDYGWRFHLGEPGVSVERNCKAEHSVIHMREAGRGAECHAATMHMAMA
jgi:hypothetical protein